MVGKGSHPTVASRIAVTERPEDQSPAMFQKWRDLLFLHWAFDPEVIQARLPDGLFVDTFDGKAYVGIVPFFMRDVRPRFLPAVPGISNFLELNLRTYVYDARGVPGVWFYSLDANQRLAVEIARISFSLPYYYAEMEAERNKGGEIHFSSRRVGTDEALRSSFRYRSLRPAGSADRGSLEFFLIERYVLFSLHRKTGKLMFGRVYHAPYPLSVAEVSEWDDHLFEVDGFDRPGRGPDHVLMSSGVDVETFRVKGID